MLILRKRVQIRDSFVVSPPLPPALSLFFYVLVSTCTKLEKITETNLKGNYYLLHFISLSFAHHLLSLLLFFTKARLPVKWMPPESIFHGESSTKSDVLVASFLSSVESIVTEYAKCVFLRTYLILLLGHALL